MQNTEVKSRVFLSHVPKDHKHVIPLCKKLQNAGFVIIDAANANTESATDTTTKSLDIIIASTDQLVFALSPRSANSKPCQRELEIAIRLNKRITPVVISELKGAPVPIMLSRLDYIFLTPPANYVMTIDSLIKTLMLNIRQVQTHARLGELAMRWDRNRGIHENLLAGTKLEQAEQWLATPHGKTPEPAELHHDFIATSRQYQKSRHNQRNKFIMGGLMLLVVMTGAIAWAQLAT